MKASLRARRMARNHEKLSRQPRLNLVALMDIFTILVFFLMVNNGDVEVLQADRNIPLPDSVSEQKPEIALTIKVSNEDIILQGKTVEKIDGLLSGTGETIASLRDELRYHASRAGELSADEKQSGRRVIIMGDQQMPYEVLKRIMTTCAQSDYRNISLAVNSTSPDTRSSAMQVAES
jgi:biopolymer transport protein ExbD